MIINIAIRDHDLGAISTLTSSAIQLDVTLRKQYEPILWRSICSEYDSINFYNKVRSLNINYTENFENFLTSWLQDEAMHTAGFKKLYQLVYDIEESQTDRALAERKPNFDSISEFLESEFSICLLLAFDEIVTAHVYEKSISFYSEVEPVKLPQWIKKVKRDEVKHFINVIKVIRSNHQYSIQAAKNILDRIVEVDTNLSNYEGTFVLDHACPEFPLSKNDLINICVKTVLKKIS